MIKTNWRHGCSAAAVTAWIVVRGAVAWTVVVIVGIVLRPRSILRCSHNIVGLPKVLTWSRLRCVSESQPSRINDSIVSN